MDKKSGGNGRNVYLETYGCSANQAESEIMAGLLSGAGFAVKSGMEDSDLVVLNTCFVKTPTEQRILARIREIAERFPEKRLIIAGCMPEALGRKLKSIASNASMASTHNITRIAEVAERALAGEKAVFTGRTGETKLCLPRQRKNPFIGITEISQGCNGNCSYCCVRLAKGPLYCYPAEDVTKDAGNAVSAGCREIWLTSQDNASYSCGGVGLPGLVDKICSIEGYFRVRIGMMNPENVLAGLPGIMEAFGNEKVYKFLHVPVQSGSDEVLKRMRRNYRSADFLKIVSEFRKSVPSITLSTDIIVGFPGESEHDVRKTAELLERARPDIVNVSKFGPRPKTEAAGMDRLDGRVVKRRSAEISALVRKIALENNGKWRGWKGEILISEKGRKKNQWVGRNFAYKPVLVESSENLMGKAVTAEIEKAETTHLLGFLA